MWLALLLAGLSGLLYLVTDQLLQYLSRPIRVQVSIVQNETLTLPAITICLRWEAAARLGGFRSAVRFEVWVLRFFVLGFGRPGLWKWVLGEGVLGVCFHQRFWNLLGMV